MENNIKKYRVIGDIHGRKNWIKLVTPFNENTMYIFVGDYTDPYSYEGIGYTQMVTELLKILQFKKEHPENVILLTGNHDLQYIINQAETNRYDNIHGWDLHTIFTEKSDSFSDIAYQIGEKYLITHAGVTSDWYQKWFGITGNTTNLQEICDNINNLWRENKNAFSFGENVTKFSDYYGTGPMHSPIWIRPLSLWEHNVFGFGSGKIQVVGHTRFEHYEDEYKDLDGTVMAMGTEKNEPTEEQIEKLDHYINDGKYLCRPKYEDNENPDIIQIDCLEKETACIEIDAETLEWKKLNY